MAYIRPLSSSAGSDFASYPVAMVVFTFLSNFSLVFALLMIIAWIFSIPSMIYYNECVTPVSMPLSPTLSISLSLATFYYALSYSFFLPPFRMAMVAVMTVETVEGERVTTGVDLTVVASFL